MGTKQCKAKAGVSQIAVAWLLLLKTRKVARAAESPGRMMDAAASGGSTTRKEPRPGGTDLGSIHCSAACRNLRCAAGGSRMSPPVFQLGGASRTGRWWAHSRGGPCTIANRIWMAPALTMCHDPSVMAAGPSCACSSRSSRGQDSRAAHRWRCSGRFWTAAGSRCGGLPGRRR